MRSPERSIVDVTEWDKELDTVDQKQAQLVAHQWRLVREQIGSLRREVAALQLTIIEMKSDERHHTAFEKTLLTRMEALELSHGDRAQDHHQLTRSLNALHESHSAATRDLDAFRESHRQEADNMKENLGQERRAWQDRHHGLEEQLNRGDENHTAVAKDLRSLREGHGVAAQQHKELRDALLQEGRVRQLAHDALRDSHDKLHQTLQARLDGHQRSFEAGLDDRAQAHGRLEQSLQDVHGRLDSETAQRAVLADDMNTSLKAHHARLKSHGDEWRLAHDNAHRDLHSAMNDKLEAHRLGHDARLDSVEAALHNTLQGHKLGHDARLESVEGKLHERVDTHTKNHETRFDVLQTALADVHRHQREHVSNWEVGRDTLAADIAKVAEACQSRLAQEINAREAHDTTIEQNLEALNRFLQEVGGFFSNSLPGTRPRTQMTPRRNLNGLSPPQGQGGYNPADGDDGPVVAGRARRQ